MRVMVAASIPTPESRTSRKTIAVAGVRCVSRGNGPEGVVNARLDVDATFAAYQRLRCIEDQVHDHLLELRRVRLDQGQANRQMQAQQGCTGDGKLHEFGGFAHRLVEIEGADEIAALAGVGQHLFAQVGGPDRGCFDVPQIFSRRRIAGNVQLGQVGIAQDEREEIVEVMGDPSRQNSQALQTLRFAQLSLHLILLGSFVPGLFLPKNGDVGKNFDHANDPIFLVAQRCVAETENEKSAVATSAGERQPGEGRALQDTWQTLLKPPFMGVRPADDVGSGPAEEAFRGWVPAGHPSLAIDQ